MRKGYGPFFIEAVTYRISSHYGPENDIEIGYRSEKEVLSWIKKCPIENIKNHLIKKNILTNDKVNSIKNKNKKQILKLIQVAKKDKFLNVKNLEKFNYEFKKVNNKKIKNLSRAVSDINLNKNLIIGY